MKTCFVITPIGNDGTARRTSTDQLLDLTIAPVLNDIGFALNVAHRMPHPGSITTQIIASILTSDLVIANLTDLNPNVMYELALRHASSLPMVTIAQKGTPIPFDVADFRVLFYEGRQDELIAFRKTLAVAVEQIGHATRTDNPVQRSVAFLKNESLSNISAEGRHVVRALSELGTMKHEWQRRWNYNEPAYLQVEFETDEPTACIVAKYFGSKSWVHRYSEPIFSHGKWIMLLHVAAPTVFLLVATVWSKKVLTDLYKLENLTMRRFRSVST